MKGGKDSKAEKYNTPEYDGKATKVFAPKAGKAGVAALDASGEPGDVTTQSLGAPELFDGHAAAAATRGVSCAKKALAAEYLLDRVSSHIDSNSTEFQAKHLFSSSHSRSTT